jgi:hypothetical protein
MAVPVFFEPAGRVADWEGPGGSSIPPAVLLSFPERDQPEPAVRTNVSSIASRSSTKRLALSSADQRSEKAIAVSDE